MKMNKKIRAGALVGAASTIGLVGIGATLGYVCPFCVMGLMASGGLISMGAIEEKMKKKTAGK